MIDLSPFSSLVSRRHDLAAFQATHSQYNAYRRWQNMAALAGAPEAGLQFAMWLYSQDPLRHLTDVELSTKLADLGCRIDAARARTPHFAPPT